MIKCQWLNEEEDIDTARRQTERTRERTTNTPEGETNLIPCPGPQIILVAVTAREPPTMERQSSPFPNNLEIKMITTHQISSIFSQNQNKA